MAGSRLGAVGTETNNGAGTGGAKGWLICSTTDNCGRIAAGALRHSKWLAMLTSSENGTRNFTEAASHSLCRTAARFLRSISVSRATKPEESVDCHK
jgi:hypothetical protein